MADRVLRDGMGRRSFLSCVAASGLAAATAGLLTACGSTAHAVSDIVTVGLAPTNPTRVPLYRAVIDGWQRTNSAAVAIDVSTFSDFTASFAAYLTGAPDDLFVTTAGADLRFAVRNGLLSPIGETARQAEPSRSAYLYPIAISPVMLFYRRAVWAERGWKVPVNLADFITLTRRMRADGVIPLALGGAEAEAAGAWFDQIDLAVNGADFHRALLHGRARWSSTRAADALNMWRRLSFALDPAAAKTSTSQAIGKFRQGRAAMLLTSAEALLAKLSAPEAADLAWLQLPAVQAGFGPAVVSSIEGLSLSRPGSFNSAARSLLDTLATDRARAHIAATKPSITAGAPTRATVATTTAARLAEIVTGAQVVAPFQLEAEASTARAALPALRGFLASDSLNARLLDGAVAAA